MTACILSWYSGVNAAANDPSVFNAPLGLLTPEDQHTMRRLLLLACSARKRPDPGHLRAIERYDGPAYHVLRRHLRTQPDAQPEVYIVSARFGLISGEEPVPPYDCRLTAERIMELRATVAEQMRTIEPAEQYKHIFVHAGTAYRTLLSAADARLLTLAHVAVASGGSGMMLAQLRQWLAGDTPETPQVDSTIDAPAVPARFKLRGREFICTREQALSVSRWAIQNGNAKALATACYAARVDGQDVSPKWLVSQLTGLSVSEFHSIDARRVLKTIGLTVRELPIHSGGPH